MEIRGTLSVAQGDTIVAYHDGGIIVGQRRKSRRCGPICRRGELVLEMKCRSLQVVLM
jgi:hypothetical protein